ncbi:disease resistance protein PIK6-NP-like [Aegilops tauschii subsp. strangulata]|uniref:Disease resistance protein RPM1 n=1 Tax=Aegilops tauschii TaxID=37682 RepID=M8C941_AEGTA
MRQIVTLSYSHLPHHLKTCMMYLSIFPEDYEIKKGRLLSRWIAEGLVAERRGLTLLEVAESYFDELVSRNMIVPANISYDGRVKSCRVHDMMLEVMVSRSMEANFVSLVGGEQHEGESLGKIRRLSIQSSGGPKDERSMKHVRSLSTFHPQGHKALLERLGEFTLLRVLDLEDCKALQNKHMKHVCRMFLLRFLNLNGTDISKMPKKIGKLVHLQTLNLWNTLLHGLPQSVTELEKLESLYFHNRESYFDCRLPCGLGRMKALRVLDKMVLHDDGADAAREIGELTQLRKLNISIDCSQEVLQVLITALNRTYSLRQLSILDRGNGKIMNILGEMTSPPLLLRSMEICGGIDGMPEWFGSLMHLGKLDISYTMLSSDEILGILCELPNLLRLTLGFRSCTNDALVISAEYRFPVLKQLNVHSVQKEIIFEQGSMAMLEKLEVGFGSEEKSLSGIEHLPSLKVVVLAGLRSNRTLHQTVPQLKLESDRRPVPNQFKVVAPARIWEEL